MRKKKKNKRRATPEPLYQAFTETLLSLQIFSLGCGELMVDPSNVLYLSFAIRFAGWLLHFLQ